MSLRATLLEGHVMPAHPLALTARRRLDERRQRALTRYYVAAGAGGVAVGVHTTQFAIRGAGLYRPVLELAAAAADEALGTPPRPFVRVAGLVGRTRQAVAEAETARALGYDAGLLSLAAFRDADDRELLRHCRAVAATIPLFGFYLQPAVGGRVLGYRFWRALAESVEDLVAIKVAPFNRYQTLDVVRGVVDAGRAGEVALYTGNDDNIIPDLLTPFPTPGGAAARIVGGLLGQWAVWTRRAVETLDRIKAARAAGSPPDPHWLSAGAALTDANGAIFDARHAFAGCIPGIHEVLRRQGLLRGLWTLDPNETLSPGQRAEIDRVCRAYPELTDDEFVEAGRDEWMR
ncbi:MAG TPA: dihydrodipicolinate synthase family protein [Gemmatimonadaceae bacterium]|nr:dihydrodipicolinate synthase family protein [Gemmatimonadaceae bacterium]